jgi:hypothetical protein
MTFTQFAESVELLSKKEIDKVKLISFYFQTIDKEHQITIDDISEYFEKLGIHKPNKSRLHKNLLSSKEFVRGKSSYHFRLHTKVFSLLNEQYASVFEEKKSEAVTLSTDGLVLSKELYKSSRKYLENLGNQINASYENNIFDGCAVLMRRLFEILLIHSYENLKIDAEIRDGTGNYRMLGDIVNNAKTNVKLGLSRNTRDSLDNIRELGNFSAHKIYYNAKKYDIDRAILNFRACIEELLYLSGIRK